MSPSRLLALRAHRERQADPGSPERARPPNGRRAPAQFLERRFARYRKGRGLSRILACRVALRVRLGRPGAGESFCDLLPKIGEPVLLIGRLPFPELCEGISSGGRKGKVSSGTRLWAIRSAARSGVLRSRAASMRRSPKPRKPTSPAELKMGIPAQSTGTCRGELSIFQKTFARSRSPGGRTGLRRHYPGPRPPNGTPRPRSAR